MHSHRPALLQARCTASRAARAGLAAAVLAAVWCSGTAAGALRPKEQADRLKLDS